MRNAISLAGLAIAFIAATTDAQAPRDGDRFLTRSYGAPILSAAGPHFGLVRNRRVFQSAVQAEWVLADNRAFALSSTVEGLLAIVFRPTDAPRTDCVLQRPPPGKIRCFPVDRPSSPVAGFGLTPLGLKLYVAPASPVRFFASAAGGGIFFDRETPVQESRRANFSAEFLLGAEFTLSRSADLSIAWKFQHWSNAGTAYMNPGIDANLLYLSIKRRRFKEPTPESAL
jgi:uncharacterized protein YfiM (DUF2279 family)